MRYSIMSKSGISYGKHEGEKPVDALASMYRDSGWPVTVGDDGELKFTNPGDAGFCGGISDVIIVPVNSSNK